MVAGKVRLDGEKEMAEARVPVPLTDTDWGAPKALSIAIIVAVADPEAVGLKT